MEDQITSKTIYISQLNSASLLNETSVALNLVLSEKFSNGFRFTSDIEISRLRKFLRELLDIEIILSNEDIIRYVKGQGIEFDGKVYFITTETRVRIAKCAIQYFNDGASAIFYEEFFIKHKDWLFESSVVDTKMLADIFRIEFQQMIFTTTYFGYSNESIFNVLKNEILRVWGNDVLLTFDNLAKRLKYVPLYRIKQLLGQSEDFIWNSIGEYTHISKFKITEEERNEIRGFVENEIQKHSYLSILDITMGEISEHNYNLSITALHTAIFYICLADLYDRYGKIITRKGEKINALYIMENHCRSLDRTTLDALLALERDLTNECHRWIPMTAGYNTMIRIDADNFVAEKYLDFDIIAVDNAVEHFMGNTEYIPLQSVNTFAVFPYCGQSWNLFLLESYCRRFSEHFRFECLSVNSRNSGVIIRKHSRLSYFDIMADALAKSEIILNEKSVLNFLVESGYISKRKYAKTFELIKQAKFLRG